MKKVLQTAVVTLAISTAILFGYGIYRFPDAPIRQCGDDCFRNKLGEPRTADEYHAFYIWLRVTPTLLVSAVVLGFILNVVETRRSDD